MHGAEPTHRRAEPPAPRAPVTPRRADRAHAFAEPATSRAEDARWRAETARPCAAPAKESAERATLGAQPATTLAAGPHHCVTASQRRAANARGLAGLPRERAELARLRAAPTNAHANAGTTCAAIARRPARPTLRLPRPQARRPRTPTSRAARPLRGLEVGERATDDGVEAEVEARLGTLHVLVATENRVGERLAQLQLAVDGHFHPAVVHPGGTARRASALPGPAVFESDAKPADAFRGPAELPCRRDRCFSR